MNERIEATVHGKVQGVWFRDFVREKALALGLLGKVENMEDGTVRVVAEGPTDAIETLVGHLYEGPELAKVDAVLVARQQATGEHATFTKH